eukprot:1737381-Ditylum_brightwellii.AAC.1
MYLQQNTVHNYLDEEIMTSSASEQFYSKKSSKEKEGSQLSDYPNLLKDHECFSWREGKAANEWWTHRPWYEVTVKNDNGFCFSQIENITKRTFMTKVYENQFQGNCSNFISRSMASSGWGYDFISLADALWKGINKRRPVQMVLMGLSGAKQGVWHYTRLKDRSKP